MKDHYSQSELDALLATVQQRNGWDFSVMKTIRADVPWDYVDEVKKHLEPTDTVLDVGTGGGERFAQLAPFIKAGVGIDIDPEMVKVAQENTKNVANLQFTVDDDHLKNVDETFDVIINRHAVFDLQAVKEHLKSGGLFITQQVGEKNMQNVKEALGQPIGEPEITAQMLTDAGLTVVDFREYNVGYVVQDVASLVFWLNALDMLHADVRGKDALQSADIFNKILAGHVDERGFVTNEQRYLAVASN